jgi:two-component system cell cycle response regulator
VPIVAVTAFAMVANRDKILAHGFDGYIAKPITPRNLPVGGRAVHPETPATRAASAPALPAAGRRRPRSRRPGHSSRTVDNSPVNLSLAESTLGTFGSRWYGDERTRTPWPWRVRGGPT